MTARSRTPATAPHSLPETAACPGCRTAGGISPEVRMIEIGGPATRLCDGVPRRQFLQIGALGSLGLSLPGLVRAEAAAPPAKRREISCILLWLQGGPSQIDTFDPKPEAPADIRGPFGPLETNVAGIRIADVFPRLARRADRFALLRSVYHPVPAHIVGHQWMLCGA